MITVEVTIVADLGLPMTHTRGATKLYSPNVACTPDTKPCMGLHSNDNEAADQDTHGSILVRFATP